MLSVRDLAVLALLAVACSADGVAQRFFFPSQQLLLDTPDARVDSGHGRRVPASGGPAEGASGTSHADGGEGGQSTSQGPVRRIREPSRCTFAIVGCCRAGSIRIDDHCFGQFECHGPFWGESPCRRESAVVAYNIVSKYYAAKEAEKRGEEATAEPAAAAPAAEPEPSSPFDPIGPLPSREDARMNG